MTASPPPPTMPLRVTRNDEIADGIHLLEFRDPAGNELPQFTGGAHIAVRVPNGLLRKYSLCNDPAERDRYQIAVKREVTGRGGSINLIDDVKAGDELIVTAPVNDFGLPPRAQDFLFIAGGIGVTPMVAMIRQVMAEGKRFRLFYCSRSPETTAFRDELGAPAVQGYGHHPLRRWRRVALVRLAPDFGGTEKPRASLLLRAAPADGSSAGNDRPLVADGRALRSIQRGGNSQSG